MLAHRWRTRALIDVLAATSGRLHLGAAGRAGVCGLPARARAGAAADGLATRPPRSAARPLCERAGKRGSGLLDSLGHECEEWRALGGQSCRSLHVVFGTPIAMGLFFGTQVSGREPAEELVEPLSWTIWNGIRERSALDYLLARTQLGAFSRSIVALWSDHDVVMTPALAQRPVRIGEIDACSAEPWEDFRRSGQFTPYTAIFNVTGQPAVSLPLFHGEDGLPLGVQLAGRPAGEGELLALAAQLEAARPWSGRRPERRQLQQ